MGLSFSHWRLISFLDLQGWGLRRRHMTSGWWLSLQIRIRSQITGNSSGKIGEKTESYSVLVIVTTKIWYFKVEEILANTKSLRGETLRLSLTAVEWTWVSAWVGLPAPLRKLLCHWVPKGWQLGAESPSCSRAAIYRWCLVVKLEVLGILWQYMMILF